MGHHWGGGWWSEGMWQRDLILSKDFLAWHMEWDIIHVHFSADTRTFSEFTQVPKYQVSESWKTLTFKKTLRDRNPEKKYGEVKGEYQSVIPRKPSSDQLLKIVIRVFSLEQEPGCHGMKSGPKLQPTPSVNYYFKKHECEGMQI